MAKGRKTGGRKPGSLNATTASVKAALVKAFDQRGGVKALVAWAEEQPTAFYQLWGRLAPTEVTANVAGKLEVVVRVAKEGRRITSS
jgi:hypothetical protein